MISRIFVSVVQRCSCFIYILPFIAAFSHAVQANNIAPPRGDAEQAFAEFGSSIFQVRIINLKSHNLNSSGTGFFVADGHLVATNYHVISSVVLEPQEYKVVIKREGREVALEVVAIDVVNDLAVLRVEEQGKPLLMRALSPSKGEKLYSIGNPHNIGMTIVEGNYNGLADGYVFDRIHFSGALNPGMSGGPTIDVNGDVVGVNVQTAGNQVGFLVPVEKLTRLLDGVSGGAGAVAAAAEPEEVEDLTEATQDDEEPKVVLYEHLQHAIGEQIMSATSTLIDEINARDWPTELLSDATVVGEVHPGFHCWGQSDTDEKLNILTVVKGCNSRQSIYVSSELDSGYFEYEFRYIEGKDWPAMAFYQYASNEFSHGRPSNSAGEEDVEDFTCVNDIIEREDGSVRRRAAFCARPYKKYGGLYDTFYMGVTIDKNNRALMEHFCLSGVDKQKSNEFMARFIQQVKWQ